LFDIHYLFFLTLGILAHFRHFPDNQLASLFEYSSLSIMMSLFRFIFAVFCFTAILVFAVYLRSANHRIFYKLCTHRAEQSRLKQQLATSNYSWKV